ncbi:MULTISPECIES: tyrosinase family protein [unclassified Kribbella]|uniref:tyrosinase family protein n=1 Tax=unclassified Kribbella TaxID=2644121 RepID=UPI0033C3EE1D
MLRQTGYRNLQVMLESRSDEFRTPVPSGNQLHNGMHGYIGGDMGNPMISPFDPIFYLHHCHIDRLWARWQADGHATQYPCACAKPEHGPASPMYPCLGQRVAVTTR